METLEQRAAVAAHEKQREREQVVQSMRQEIGPQHYEAAKRALPTLEHAITTELWPFLTSVRYAERTSGTPLPQYVVQWLKDIEQICAGAAAQLRDGIHGYEHLTGEMVVPRATLIDGIRVALRSHDGKLSFARRQKAIVEQYIRDSGWPRGAQAARVASVPEPISEPEIKVET
jgi:hypothetical protein